VTTAYIVDAVRTAGGRRGGRLAGVHPAGKLFLPRKNCRNRHPPFRLIGNAAPANKRSNLPLKQ